jgi:hypothetical protein
MFTMPHKDWRKLGTRTIEVMLYGSGGYKMKNIHRVVYTEKTLIPRYSLYWFELKKNQWRNTSREGVHTGIVVSSSEFRGLKERL